MTHQAPFNVDECFVLALKRFLVFCDGRTDTMFEKNDHLIGHRGLVGQKVALRTSERKTIQISAILLELGFKIEICFFSWVIQYSRGSAYS